MAEYVQVVTTVQRREDAQRLARELVQRRLAGCAQVLGPIESVYHWQGRIETAEEWQVLFKTRRDLYPALDAALGELHPYDVPEILAVPVVEASPAYLDWLEQSLLDQSDGSQ